MALFKLKILDGLLIAMVFIMVNDFHEGYYKAVFINSIILISALSVRVRDIKSFYKIKKINYIKIEEDA